jgi:hypothetical protein
LIIFFNYSCQNAYLLITVYPSTEASVDVVIISSYFNDENGQSMNNTVELRNKYNLREKHIAVSVG